MRLRYMRLACVLGCFIFGAGSLGAWPLDDTDSMRCGDKIVLIGDPKYEVFEKCGEPSAREEWGDIWIYNFGPAKFVYYVTFTEGVVERIQVDGFGN